MEDVVETRLLARPPQQAWGGTKAAVALQSKRSTVYSRDPLQPRHGLRKFSDTGAKLLILHPDLGATAVACQVRMVAKISDGPELSCAAVGTDDFYGHFIQCVPWHLQSHSGDSQRRIVMPGASAECGRRHTFPSSISISVKSAFLQLTARKLLLYAKRIKADLSIRAAPGIWPEEAYRLAKKCFGNGSPRHDAGASVLTISRYETHI